ncbi:MAG: hypothetical protein N2327_03420 [Caldimicrobium sp.]|nr:hypothetical protein [Caldimicrobium sp.]MCX7873467.1 hypothetical protein [Caldimicrobium sp.]MDW8182811.1 hypothetical protein [Caldimicrobium sp.]
MDLERVKAFVLDTFSPFLDQNNLSPILFGSKVESDKLNADLYLLIFYSEPLEAGDLFKIKESLDLIEDIPCKVDLLEEVKR